MDMRFDTWNVRSLYRAGSLMTVAKEKSKYKLGQMGQVWHRTSRVLRRIFGRRRDEVIRCWSKQHNEELHNFHSSPSISRMIKSRRMRWAGHVARIGRRGIRIGY
jgi:hypothetical protein